jgi:hypothetical protein
MKSGLSARLGRLSQAVAARIALISAPQLGRSGLSLAPAGASGGRIVDRDTPNAHRRVVGLLIRGFPTPDSLRVVRDRGSAETHRRGSSSLRSPNRTRSAWPEGGGVHLVRDHCRRGEPPKASNARGRGSSDSPLASACRVDGRTVDQAASATGRARSTRGLEFDDFGRPDRDLILSKRPSGDFSSRERRGEPGLRRRERRAGPSACAKPDLSTRPSITEPARATEATEGRQSPSHQIWIQPERGCHRAVTRLYPPLARKRDRDRRVGTARLLLSSAGFVRFRAPIDSVTDPGGQPRQPTDPFLSFRCGFGPLNG